MKKKYSLDYSVEGAGERLHIVEDICNTTTNLTNSDLELLANYILNGRDENGKKTKLGNSCGTRHRTFLRAEDKNESLDAIMESEAQKPEMLPYNTKRIYKSPKRKLTRDADTASIPGMQDLWDSIDRLDAEIKKLTVAEGDNSQKYNIYRMKHWLIELRREQYYLRDSYRPTLHFLNIIHSKTPSIDWGNDTMRDGINREFDYENPKHIRGLMKYYSDIYQQLYDDPYAWGRIIILDFERLVEQTKFTPLEWEAFILKIDGLSTTKIYEKIVKEFGKYSLTYIYTLTADIIPRKIAATAKKQRLLRDNNYPRVKCTSCEKILPHHQLFFTRDKQKKQLSNICRNCSNGGRRYGSKTKDMFEMQTNKSD